MPDVQAKASTARDAKGDSEEALKACTEIDAELAELRVAYEQYFMGVERRPPSKQHEATRKRIRGLKNQFVRQTAAKFRIESISQKLLTYERLWDRTMKEIEAGTYKRHLIKAKRHTPKAASAAADDAHNFDVDEDLDLSDLDDGNLDEALAQASAGPTLPPPPAPLAPMAAVAPAVPAALTAVTGALPSIAPLVPSISPLVAPVAPAVPALVITSPLPVSQSKPPPGRTGLTPAGAMAAVAPKGATGAQPAMAPKGATGVTAAVAPKGATGAQPAMAPKGATGSHPASKPPAPVAADGGLSEQKIKAIYDAYVMAKKRCGEDTSKLSLNSVADTLKKQVPALMKQHDAKSVEFKVVIKDGKAVLRALPKE